MGLQDRQNEAATTTAVVVSPSPGDADIINQEFPTKTWGLNIGRLGLTVVWRLFRYNDMGDNRDRDAPGLDEVLDIGDSLYYPSANGIALIIKVIEKTEKDLFVEVEGVNAAGGKKLYKWYIPRKSISQHGIPLDVMKSKVYVAQNLFDPDNQIMYLRYVWTER